MGIRHTVACPIKPELKETIKLYSVVIYSKSQCQDCFRAKQAFRQMGIEPYIIETDLEDNQRMIMRGLFQLTGQSQVPVVFIGGKHIGGIHEVTKGIRSGEIQNLLKKSKIEFKENGSDEEY